MIILGILFIILAILLLIGIAMDDVDNDGSFLRVLAGGPSVFALILVGAAFIVESQLEPKPEALDVYRGKTELQINYKAVKGDTIPTDSIVIWK